MIAAKFEEIFPPELKEFVYITDDTYSGVQVHFFSKRNVVYKITIF